MYIPISYVFIWCVLPAVIMYVSACTYWVHNRCTHLPSTKCLEKRFADTCVDFYLACHHQFPHKHPTNMCIYGCMHHRLISKYIYFVKISSLKKQHRCVAKRSCQQGLTSGFSSGQEGPTFLGIECISSMNWSILGSCRGVEDASKKPVTKTEPWANWDAVRVMMNLR